MILVWVGFIISLFFVIFWLLAFVDGNMFLDTKKIKRYPFVTISVPAYNEERTILKSLNSLVALNYPKDKFEIIVINDCSKDKTKDVVEKFIKDNKEVNIHLVNNVVNSGKGKGMNESLKLARGEFFVCLDADSWIEQDALLKMLPHFEDNKNVAVVLPLMKIENPESYLQKLQWCEYLLNFFYKSLMATLDCVHVAPGPFSVYRKQVLIDVGGFAEGNLTEDFEVTLKIQKGHYKIIQLLDTTVYTGSPKTFDAFVRQRNRWYKGTMLNLFDYKDMIFNKKYGDFGVLQLPRVLLSGFLAVLFIGLGSYRFVFKPLYIKILNWNSINFDFSVWLGHLDLRINWLDFNYTNLFFGAVSLTLSLIVVYYAYNFTKEKVFKQGFLAVPLYIVAYGMLASAVWATVFFDLIRGKRQRW